MRELIFLLAASASLSLGNAAEALHFPSRTCDIVPKDTDLSGEAVFPFVNVSAKPITITLVLPACPCTVPHLEKTTYLPGERGEIHVDLLFGSMAGVQNRKLEVQSDHPDGLSTIIEVVMHLPSGPTLDPPILHWRQGEAAGTKTVMIDLPADFHHRLLSVTSSHPAVTAMLVPAIEAAGAPHIDVAVTSTAQPLVATLQIMADTGKQYQVFITVDEHQ